jgi:hypothetical protein
MPAWRLGRAMAKCDKLSKQQEQEREARKRIPVKTQELLSKMISRRFAELCGPPAGRKPKRKPYMPEFLPPLTYEREPEAAAPMEAGKADFE